METIIQIMKNMIFQRWKQRVYTTLLEKVILQDMK